MFTVLIAEKGHLDSIQHENKLFFEPFLESKELAFCAWDTNGQTLAEAVPGLYDTVGRRKEWRAVIINNCTGESLKKQNPFDVVDISAIKALGIPERQPGDVTSDDEKIQEISKEDFDKWEKSWIDYYEALTKETEKLYREALEHPLQKLSTWLCFRPEDYILNEVHNKLDVHEWAMEKIGRYDLKPSARLELFERNHYKYELRLKETIRREFSDNKYLNIAYPQEVHCISARTADNIFFDPQDYWNMYRESDYSLFADRNMYFDKMRFMVFDLLSQEHRNYRNDYIRFLATILIFVSNPVPSSAMQARRLYVIESKTDETPLCTLVTSYDKKLADTSAIIDGEIDKIRNEIPAALTDKAAQSMFCTPKDVPVTLDEDFDSEKVFAEKDYGFCFDSPENEFHKWNRSFSASEKELTYVVKQQARCVKKSVEQVNAMSEISNINVSRLTPFQIDDIRDYTENAENEMIESIPPEPVDINSFKERIYEESDNIRKIIKRRMSQKATIILSLICLGLYFVCFLPFLLSNNGTIKTVSTAITLVVAMLGLLLVVMFFTLYFMRSSLMNAIRSYNNCIHDIMTGIQSSLKKYSKYLSTACNVRRGHLVLFYAERNLDEYTKSIHIRKKHQEDIRKKRAQLRELYGDYFGDSTFCDDTMTFPYEYDFDQKTEYTYPAPFLAGDCRQIEFISGGNYVTVPSSYVTEIIVRMEGVYDK